MQKTYVCECGKIFDNPQKFNGHKQGCYTHIVLKYGSIDSYLKIKNRSRVKAAKSIHNNAVQRKQQELNNWIAEKHTCERCGKVMTEKFATGRFCSRSCANSKVKTDETISKIRTTAAINGQSKHAIYESNYLKNPKYCSCCGKILPYSMRRRKTCSSQCYHNLFKIYARDKHLGGPNNFSSFGKKGTYKGIHCDSTYELAYVIYCMDHNIKIERNSRYFDYYYNDKLHHYYPDFYLPDTDTYIEIKGRDIGPVKEKIEGIVKYNVNYKIYYYEDLIEIFDYIKDTYNIFYNKSANSIVKLYDR